MILAFIYLLFVSLGLGFGLWKLLKIQEDDQLSAFFMIMGSGIAIFVVSSTVIGYLNLSNWMIYLALTFFLLALAVREGLPKLEKPAISKEWLIIIAILLVFLYVYTTGALSYAWLEDDDPWSHASAARYVSIYGTYIQPEPRLIHYLAPYPPFFDVLMGVLFQVDGASLQIILKFFNVFLVALCIPLFYCFARRRFDPGTALWASAILAALPSFMSHFIWSQTFAIFLSFVAFYFLDRYLDEKNENRKNLGIMAAIAMASVMITQPSVAALVFAMGVIYAAARVLPEIIDRRTEAMAAIKDMWPLLGGLLVSIILFWGPMMIIFGTSGVLQQIGLTTGFVTGKSEDTSGGVIYNPGDFIIAPFSSKMDQPVGWGVFVTALMILGLGVSILNIRNGEKRGLYLAVVLWLVFCILGVEGNALPVKMMPHRFWVLLALPVAILAGIGTVRVLDLASSRWNGLSGVMIAIIAIGILWSSAYPKYVVETSTWPPGTSWVSTMQLGGYETLKNTLAPNTKVFSFCSGEDLANGMDMFGYAWDSAVADYKKVSINDSADNNYRFLKKYNYSYAIIDQGCLIDNDPITVQDKLQELALDGGFSYQENLSGNASIVFRID